MALTVIIRGLWAVLERKPEAEYHGVAPSGGNHNAVLVARTASLEVDEKAGKYTTWEPDFVGHVSTGAGVEQIAMWKIGGHALTFTATGKVKWTDRKKSIDFADYHAGAKVKSREEIEREDPTSSLAIFVGGSPISEEDKNEFTVKKGDKSEKRPVARQIRWTNLDKTITNKAGLIIQLKPDANAAEPVVFLTNAAPTPNGFGHFVHYYELVDVKKEERITIAAATEETYDCVPPVPGP